MENHSPDPVTDTHPSLTSIRIHITARLDPDVHEMMTRISERTGQSLNSMINKACRDSLAPPGGAAKIARESRRLPRRKKGEQVRAATAYLLSYLGNGRAAAKWWPWGGRFAARPGDRDSLWRAGALLVGEYNGLQEGMRWGTSASPSARG